MVSATIVGSGWAAPAPVRQDTLWDDFFAHHYGGSRLAKWVWRHAGVTTRHGVVDPRVEDISVWTTGERMRRFLSEALPLGKAALAACLDDAGLAPDDVDHFTVVTCTGYATPGLDVLLARDLGMKPSLERLHVGHMGCYAALPALATAADTAAARDRSVALLCLELTSLHLQPADDDVEQMVAHALFSDAAAAMVVAPGGGGLGIVDVASRTDITHADKMTWDVTDAGFRMRLSPRVPDVLRGHVAPVVGELLSAHDLAVGDVSTWAIHPGGPRIIDVVAEELGLEDHQVAHSREALARHGNCSSATVPLILDGIARSTPDPGSLVVALAFGPGLTLYAALLRMTA